VDPDKPSDLEYISALRRRSPRAWIIMVIPVAGIDTHRLRSYCGADAFLTTPFSMEDLLHRLAAFHNVCDPWICSERERACKLDRLLKPPGASSSRIAEKAPGAASPREPQAS